MARARPRPTFLALGWAQEHGAPPIHMLCHHWRGGGVGVAAPQSAGRLDRRRRRRSSRGRAAHVCTPRLQSIFAIMSGQS